jgi:Domain of unknown function (DUF4185)
MTIRRVIPAAAGVIFVGVLVAAILELRTAIHQNAYVSFTTKVCQLTGEEDRERPPGKPTGAQLSGAPSGITGSDLGYPFEARNHLYFLFGDTREVEPELCPPYICGTSTAPKAALPALVKPVGSQQEWDLRTRGRDGADSIATTPLDIDPERCLPLTFLMDAPNPFEGVTPKFHAILLNGKHLGLFETPVSGFSDGGTIYAFFSVRDIRPPDCKRPEGCALGDDQPGGQSKFAMSLDGGRTFRELYVVSRAKFEWPVPVVEDPKNLPGLPAHLTNARGVVVILASAREKASFRHSYPYLAVAPLSLIGVAGSWSYYTGTGSDGKPTWSNNQADARELPPFGSLRDEAQFGPGYHQCLGEFSVQYVKSLQKWMMLYTCDNNPNYNPNNGRGIFLRTADLPWGPWSAPRRVFDPNIGYCHFMHKQEKEQEPEPCDKGAPNPADEGVRDPDITKRAWGGEYAPFLLPQRYFKTDGNTMTFYFVMSTWNPYQVVLMKTQMQPAPWWDSIYVLNRPLFLVPLGVSTLLLLPSLISLWRPRRADT